MTLDTIAQNYLLLLDSIGGSVIVWSLAKKFAKFVIYGILYIERSLYG